MILTISPGFIDHPQHLFVDPPYTSVVEDLDHLPLVVPPRKENADLTVFPLLFVGDCDVVVPIVDFDVGDASCIGEVHPADCDEITAFH